jgi:hypothetical protein
MSWLARLSPAQAVRWALLWPALLITVTLGVAAFVAAAHAHGNWGFAFGIESRGPIPARLAVAAVVVAVVVVPPALFLALWRVARH